MNRFPTEAVEAMLARYSACADRVPGAEGWESCFLPDVEVRIFGPGRSVPLVLAGRDAVGAAFDGVADPVPHLHLVANTVIEFDGAGVRLDSCFARVDLAGEGRVGSFGRYLDRAVPCADGRWRMSHRDIRVYARLPGR
ncbi:nuclear transport factor 2 family protein [Actinomadura bangladeshensis]|uniref:Nuclear transport factor 2 family protein n=1 Tax=Actinomadura bangladeshensis TaxID=453573 RepID=A0A4R4PCI5_9ACTN|nr:nuclear transport factor 2 family protein [Actinomadura bangladeshensis]TDC20341.1 nuclear transport factor 2 family protein [Actinomadura bangladeshensis]